MSEAPHILHIAINKPLRHCFDYLAPEEADPHTLRPGSRILVPFGKKQLIGIILKINPHPCIPGYKLKSARAILDPEPLLEPNLFALYEWASCYYHHPIGEVILGTWPKHLHRPEPLVVPTCHQDSCAQQEQQPPPPLNPHQQHAKSAILASTGFKTFLLQGITGSGKTEVYLQVIQQILQQGKQALVLVPEIGLTPQTIARFTQRFPVAIALYHSKLSHRKRAETWLKARSGEARIIIGTRSAIFLPLARPGIIILDEEHDTSFKQQSGFRYSARDVAIKRGSLEAIPVLLGTATPSLESLHNVHNKRFSLLSLPERAGNATHPSFHLIDLRNHYLEEGLSPQLLKAIAEHLNQNNQVLLFLNRRGFAPVLLCHQCGWMAHCTRCDAKLNLHLHPPRLICHHCNQHAALPKTCHKCQQPQLVQVGVGTERLEEALHKHFPTTPITRIDRDSVRHKNTLEKMLTEIQKGAGQILIGTQMLAKGHHFPKVTLVGIIDTDSGFLSADFRASERMGQLIIQVAGRAGRACLPGQVFLQTHHPHNPLLQSLIQQGYPALAAQLLQERRLAQWPPFSFLTLLRAEATAPQAALGFLKQAHNLGESLKNTHIQILGPIPAPLERKAGHFRALLLFQAKHRPTLHQWLDQLIPLLDALKLGRKVRWSIDVDPLEIY